MVTLQFAVGGDLALLVPELFSAANAPKTIENAVCDPCYNLRKDGLHNLFQSFESDGGRYKFAKIAKEFENDAVSQLNRWCKDLPGQPEKWNLALARSYWKGLPACFYFL